MQFTIWQWVGVAYIVSIALSHLTFILGRQVSFRFFRCAPKLTGEELRYMFIPGVNLYFTYLNLHFAIHGLWVLFWNPDAEIEVTDEMLEDMEGTDMEFLDEYDDEDEEDEEGDFEVVFTLDEEDEEEDDEDET